MGSGMGHIIVPVWPAAHALLSHTSDRWMVSLCCFVQRGCMYQASRMCGDVPNPDCSENSKHANIAMGHEETKSHASRSPGA